LIFDNPNSPNQEGEAVIKKILKSLLIFCFIFSPGCGASHQKKPDIIPVSALKNAEEQSKEVPAVEATDLEKLNNKIDQLQKTVDQVNTKLATIYKKSKNPKWHALTFTRYWGFPLAYKDLNDEWASVFKQGLGMTYRGLSVSGANPDGFWRFGFVAAKSRVYTLSESNQIVPDPDDLSQTWAEINIKKKEMDIFLLPSLSFPIYKKTIKGLPYRSNLELRLGVAYETHLYLKYEKYDFSVLTVTDKRLTLPNDLSLKGYPTGVGIIDFNIGVFHTGLQLSFNKIQTRASLEVGVRW